MRTVPDAEHDLYRTLGVGPDATREELLEARRFLLLAYHPDRFRDAAQRARADDLAKRVNAAWETLGDPVARAAYDGRRRAERGAPRIAQTPKRSIPCPSCATVSAVTDLDGRMAELTCRACGERFTAIVGARSLGRPRLSRRGLGMRYDAVLAGGDGTRRSVSFRKLPRELALSDGERISVVLHPRSRKPVYALLHGEGLDLGWRVR